MELHKAYIQSWSEDLENAPEELFRAIKDAERISDYLIEKGEFEIPKVQELAQSAETPQPGENEPAKSLDEIVAEAVEQASQPRKEPRKRRSSERER